MTLIDKAEIVAKIKERIETYNKGYANGDERRADALEVLLHDINTLEVKEVNLDRVINDYFNEWQNVLCDEDCCNEGGFCCVLDENIKPVNIGRCRKVAKHFFELGLKTKKGE